jgi:RNA polymerase-binding transcription factor DksA
MASRAAHADDGTVSIRETRMHERISMSTETLALEQIRSRLLTRRGELRQRQERIGRDLARQHEPLSADSADRAIQLENDESLQAIGSAAVQEIEDIGTALSRLDQGLYGICAICGEEISAARLAAVPHATVCQGCGRK